MSTVDELKDRFNGLTDEDKMAFMREIMPSFCESFRKSPESMMIFCGDMMRSFGMDMPAMMRMMSMMSGKKL
jgi:hypothetical protein